ncbi:MAG: ScpA family protein [Aquiluna sp.]
MAAQLESEVDFQLHLDNFEGPFDLLLNLIGKHELDISQIALARVTDEFLKYVKQLDSRQEIESASEFLVVAATLLDMKIVSLLPQSQAVDSEDIAALEARDLLFARLLQYRAFKEISSWFSTSLELESVRVAREVRLEETYRNLRPELVWSTDLEQFSQLAQLAFVPKEIPVVGLTHLHAPKISIREQVGILVSKLRKTKRLSFRELIADSKDRGEFVARFLGVLELYRVGAISIEQAGPFSDFTVIWENSNFSDETLASLGTDYEGQ